MYINNPPQVNTAVCRFALLSKHVLCMPLYKLVKKEKNSLQVHLVPVVDVTALICDCVCVSIRNLSTYIGLAILCQSVCLLNWL